MRRAVAACCLCLFGAPIPAAAEWHITPTVGLTFAGKTTIQDFEAATGKVHPNVGIGVTFLTGGIIAFEGIATLTPGFFQAGDLDLVESSRSTALMGNVMLTVPSRWAEYSLRPFVSGGLGLLRTAQNDPTGRLDHHRLPSHPHRQQRRTQRLHPQRHHLHLTPTPRTGPGPAHAGPGPSR